MNDHLKDLVLRALAAVLVTAGLAAVLLGYVGVRRSDDIVLQMPYLASGGVGGLALLALGALLLLQLQMREQTRRAEQVTEQLEEWKTAALAEVRAFLEGAQLEVEVLSPALPPADLDAVRAPRQRRAPSRT